MTGTAQGQQGLTGDVNISGGLLLTTTLHKDRGWLRGPLPF